MIKQRFTHGRFLIGLWVALTCTCFAAPAYSAISLSPSDISWTSQGPDVRFELIFRNLDPVPSAPANGEVRPQDFGAHLPLPPGPPIFPLNIPSILPDSHFVVVWTWPRAQLPPNPDELLPGGGPPIVGVGTETDPLGCPPDDHWDGNIDVFWNEPGAGGQVNYHNGTLQVCPGGGNSYIHLLTDCQDPLGVGATWAINGLCPGYTATLVNEDFTPAPANLPPGWTGWICISADPGVPVADTCYFTVDFICDGVPATIEMCAATCDWQTKAPGPDLTNIDWSTDPSGDAVSFTLTFANPDPSLASEPVGGQMNPQPFGVFLPPSTSPVPFTVPPIPPSATIDIEIVALSLTSLPPTAIEILPGGGGFTTVGTETDPDCPPDDHWDGNVDVFWQGSKAQGQVEKHFGTLQVCPGAGNSYIHVVTDCPPPLTSTWSINGVCPGYNVTLVNEDFTPAPLNLPPGWTGWVCVNADPSIALGDTCYFDVDFTCGPVPGGTTATVEMCVVTCDWAPKAPGPELTDLNWQTNPGGGSVRFSMTFANPDPALATEPVSGVLEAQPFGAFLPTTGPPPSESALPHFRTWDLPSLQPLATFDVFFDIDIAELPPSAEIRLPEGGSAPFVGVGTETVPGCPPDGHWDGNVDVIWQGQKHMGHVEKHFGTIQSCPGAGPSYIHVVTDCPDPAGTGYSIPPPCPNYNVTLVNEDFTPVVSSVLPPGWTGWICVETAAGTPIGDTCYVDVVFDCAGSTATVELCVATCDWAPKAPGPELTDLNWSTNPGGQSVRFSMTFANPDPALATEPVSGVLEAQPFGAFLPTTGPPPSASALPHFRTWDLPSLQPLATFDVFFDIDFAELPPSAEVRLPGGGGTALAGISPETDPGCPPDGHWDGNVDVIWQGQKHMGHVEKHFGTIQSCPGAGPSYIHVVTDCPDPAGTGYSIPPPCPNYNVTLVNEDFTPAPSMLPPGWTGWICVETSAGTPIGDTCYVDVDFECFGSTVTVELCVATCDWAPKAPGPELTNLDWETTPDGQSVEFTMTFANPDPVLTSEAVSGILESQPFGAFLPTTGGPPSASALPHWQTWDIRPLAPQEVLDVVVTLPLADMPPSAEIRLPGGGGNPLVGIGTETVPGCPPDGHWDGNVDVIWQGQKHSGHVEKHFGTIQSCPGAGDSYIHVVTDCPDPAGTGWFIPPVCPGYTATLVNEDFTPAPAILPPGWTGWICVSSAAGVPIGDTCYVDVVFDCSGSTATVELCVATCDWTPKAPGAQLTNLTWTTAPGGQTVRFDLTFANPDPAVASEPAAGQVSSQPFGAFVPNHGPIGTLAIPSLPAGATFDVFFEVDVQDLPPSPEVRLPGSGPLLGDPDCPPNLNWHGNVDVWWQGQKHMGHVEKHFGELLTCPGAGPSYMHVVTDCPDPGGITWALSGLCAGFTATLLNEDMTPAPAVLPAGWTGWICVETDPSVPTGTVCCLALDMLCGGGAATIDLCVQACYWQNVGVPPVANLDFGIYNTVPNPTTGATVIAFAMPKTGKAHLEIYDASGSRVRTILNGEVAAGLNQASWDGRDGNGRIVAPGTYFARLRVDDRMMARKILMVR